MTRVSDEYYQISVEAASNRMDIRFEPLFWSVAVVDRFLGDVLECAGGLADPRESRTIVDLRNAIIQTSEVIAKIQDALAHGANGRIALVAATPLARMQTKRLLVRDGIALFTTIEDGEAWLFEDAAAGVGQPG